MGKRTFYLRMVSDEAVYPTLSAESRVRIRQLMLLRLPYRDITPLSILLASNGPSEF